MSLDSIKKKHFFLPNHYPIARSSRNRLLLPLTLHTIPMGKRGTRTAGQNKRKPWARRQRDVSLPDGDAHEVSTTKHDATMEPVSESVTTQLLPFVYFLFPIFLALLYSRKFLVYSL